MDTAYLHLEINSEALMMHTSVSVIMPQDIKRNEKLKTLYLLHGYRGNHMDWIRYTSIERYAQKYRMAVIMPEVNNAYYANMEKGLDYFTYVANELPHIMESLFPLSKKERTDILRVYQWVDMVHSKLRQKDPINSQKPFLFQVL